MFGAVLFTHFFSKSPLHAVQQPIPQPLPANHVDNNLLYFLQDSDLTEGPPRTKTATVTFLGVSDFVLPDEPVFSETFYLADYIYDTDKYRVVLTEPISLRSGYDQLVQFNIRGGNYINLKLSQCR